MGKSQKKKAMRRHNPVRVPDSHLPKGLASAASTSNKTEAVLPIIQKMTGPEASDRKWACVAVSNLIQNDPSTRRLLQGKNVVGALIDRLTDSEEEVVVEAAGALRNLCIDGGYNICAEMYNKNILAPLKTFVPKISSALSNFLDSPTAAPGNAQKLIYEFADSVITVLWCLSETSNKALDAINELHLIPFLMSFLAARDKLPSPPVTSAAHCLYVLTDDNQPAILDVKSDAGYLSCLLSIAQSNAGGSTKNTQRQNAVNILAAGILRNISPLPPPSAVSSVDIDKDIVLPLLRPTISSVNLPDISNRVQQLLTQESSIPQMENLSLKNTPKSDHKSPLEIELEQIEKDLRTIQLTLEILTGVCATLPDPSFNVSADNNEENDLDEDVDINETDEDVDVDMVSDDPSPTQSSIDFLQSLIPSLLALTKPTALSFPPLSAPSPHPPTTSALSAIHVSALECLNNIFLSVATSPNPTLSADKAAGVKLWSDIWLSLALVGTQAGLGQERRQEMWEVAAGVLWGIGVVWKGSLEPNDEQIQILIQLCNTTSDTELQIKCIGTLECLAQNPNFIAENSTISDFLLSILPADGSVSPLGTEPLIQVVSALIDIYSDEGMPYDINFRQGHYLKRLRAAADGFKRAVRGIDRKKEGGVQLRRRGEEVRDNLIAFIQYRHDLGL
ncbi:armadillo-type protein [Infundibulicybe gibba]|nr:armadillo-type protein [Infundibulicybe gibba]